MDNNKFFVVSFMLFSASVYANMDNPETDIRRTIAIAIILIVAVLIYHFAKTKIRTIKPDISSIVRHIFGFIIAIICFYILFFFVIKYISRFAF